MPGPPYAMGWDPRRGAAARAELLQSRRYAVVVQGAETPPAISLSRFRLRHLEQGSAGTCWVHSSTQLIETSANALGYAAFPVCRRLLAYVGKQLEGGGNPTDGGDPTDSLAAASAEKGAGIAHENLLPYSDGTRALGTKPPQAVYDDAKKCHLVLPVVVNSDDDSRTMIAARHGVATGMWCPSNLGDPTTFFTGFRGGSYGHSLYEIGYVKEGVWPGDYGRYAWTQIDNWWGLLYPPLPDNLAALVPGYKPIQADKTSDLWFRNDVYRRIQGYSGFIRVSATDIVGLQSNIVVPSDPDMFF